MCCCQSSWNSCHALSSLAQNSWTHPMQAAVTHMHSSHNYPHNYPTFISAYKLIIVQPSSQYSFFISGHSRSSTYIILVTNNWSFLSICFTLSLEPAPCSLSHSFNLAVTVLFLRLSHHLAVLIHSPLSSSITPSLFHSRLKTCHFFTNPSHHRLFLFQDWIHGLLTRTISSGLYRFLFLLFLIFFCLWFNAVD